MYLDGFTLWCISSAIGPWKLHATLHIYLVISTKVPLQ